MLYHQTLGQGPDIIFLHGLFGAGDNWRSIARSLSEHYRLHLIDLPNHGKSSWIDHPTHYTVAQIIEAWRQQQGIKRFSLLGHSMGGKIAMQLALNQAAKAIEKLIIVDIAPRAYKAHHQDIFAAFRDIDLNRISSRNDVEEQLRPYVSDPSIRQFLLKSLHRKDGQLAWQFNTSVLESHYSDIAAAPTMSQPFEGETLFIKGLNSHYITKEDQSDIQRLFPKARAKLIEGAGHWPHAEKPAAFQKIVSDFLEIAQ